MKKEFRIEESDLLVDEHFPVKAMFNMIADYRFKRVVKAISNNHGFGENYGDCSFWGDLDEYDQTNTEFFDGAEFWLHNDERVVISYKELLYYLEIACAGYCEDHPEDTETIRGYINDFKRLNNLS